MEVPAAEWLPGPVDLTYTGLEHTGRTIRRTMVSRGIPG